MERQRILVIEDDPDVGEILEYNLAKEGFEVFIAPDGERGLREVAAKAPALVLLDLMLPGIPGLEVCRRMRARTDWAAIPIIMVTAKGDETDVVAGLELGADDYIVKPFRVRELIARLNTVLRRSRPPDARDEERLERNGIVIDIGRHEVTIDDTAVELTLAEFRLLASLAAHPGRVIPRRRLVYAITAGGHTVSERNVDVHVAGLRRKMGERGDLIATVRGVGYKFRDAGGA